MLLKDEPSGTATREILDHPTPTTTEAADAIL
jgi:hypothetical protein